MTDHGTFLLGVGCEKGGTTWLNAYLSRTPGCRPGPRDEYHVWDLVDVPERTWVRRGILARARQAVDDYEATGRARGGDLFRLAMVTEPQVYFDYFTGLLAAPEVDLTFDVTPDYALLRAARFTMIRDEFARRGVATRAVFLMRDPVERVWSQVRMHLRSAGRTHRRSQAQLVERRFTQPTTVLRTRYELTVRALDAAFEDGEVHCELSERLFSEDGVRRLCNFLDRPYHPGAVDERVNASPKDVEALPEDTVRMVAEHFAETYRFVADRVGAEELVAAWPSARFVL